MHQPVSSILDYLPDRISCSSSPAWLYLLPSQISLSISFSSGIAEQSAISLADLQTLSHCRVSSTFLRVPSYHNLLDEGFLFYTSCTSLHQRKIGIFIFPWRTVSLKINTHFQSLEKPKCLPFTIFWSLLFSQLPEPIFIGPSLTSNNGLAFERLNFV